MGQLAQAITSVVKSVSNSIGHKDSGVQGAGAAAAAGPNSLPQAALPGAPAPTEATPLPSAAPAPSSLSSLMDSGRMFDYSQDRGPGQSLTPEGVNASASVDNPFGPKVDNTLEDIINSIGRPATALTPPPVDPLAPLPENPVAAEDSSAPQAPAIAPPAETSLAPAPVDAAAPGAAVDTAAAPAAAPWTPHHENTLQHIGDFFLRNFFKDRNDDRNLTEATKDFAKDPDAAIERVRQFAPKMAYQMAAARADDKRADLSAEALVGSRQDKAIAPLRATLGAIINSKDPTAVYARMLKPLRAMRDRTGVTDEVFPLPDEYDEDSVASLYGGGIAPTAREKMKLVDKGIVETGRHHGVTEKQTDAKIDETVHHDSVTEGQGAARVAQGAARVAQGDERVGIARNKANGVGGKPKASDFISERVTVKDAATGTSKTELQKFPKGYTRVSSDNHRMMRNEGGHWVKYLRQKDGKFYRLKPEYQ